MDKYRETFETWNKVAKLYEAKFMNLDLYNHTYDFICSSLNKSNPNILEIGCGPGNITRYLLAKRPDFNIFGIDIAPNMIELAKKNNPRANFAVMDCREINDLQGTYDGIICGFCLPYLSGNDSKKLISDCYDLLNKNGLFYLSFVEGDPKNSHFQVGSNGNRIFFYFHDLEELTEQLYMNNFDEVKIFKVEYERTKSEIHTILTAKKRSA